MMLLGIFIGSTILSLIWIFVQYQEISGLRCALLSSHGKKAVEIAEEKQKLRVVKAA